jgi:hypothetical protein
MTSTQDLLLVLGVAIGSVLLICAGAYAVFPPPPRKPAERTRLDRMETLNRSVTDALYSTREAVIWTSDDFSDLGAVRAMRDRLRFASDSLVAAQREVTEWLREAVAEQRADGNPVER